MSIPWDNFKTLMMQSISLLENLLRLCKKNTLVRDRVTLLNKRVDFPFLNSLADCEHFDVVLALNFVRHSGLNSVQTLEILRRQTYCRRFPDQRLNRH